MNSDELIRKLRRLGGVTITPSRGKGGHVRVERAGHVTVIPMASGEVKAGTLRAILRQLGLTPRDLQ